MPTFFTSPSDSTSNPLVPHVVLVGLPGSGKTTVGELLAKALGRTFLDFDLEISRRQGMSVAEIFGTRGELYFRELERSLTAELRPLGDMVLAPGGGWAVDPLNVALLKPPATMVYLRVKPATALLRMGAGAVTRPLLTRPNPVAELNQMLAARRGSYELADVVVDVERIDAQEVTRKIIGLLASSVAAKNG